MMCFAKYISIYNLVLLSLWFPCHSMRSIVTRPEAPTLQEAVDTAPPKLKDQFTAVKEDILVYTAMYGHCPATLDAVHFQDDYSESFKYGMGCHIKALCHCEYSPILACATNSYVWKLPDDVAPFVTTFGYCRVSPWVFIGLASASAVLILVIVVVVKRHRR